jgi:hypothetical protein
MLSVHTFQSLVDQLKKLLRKEMKLDFGEKAKWDEGGSWPSRKKSFLFAIRKIKFKPRCVLFEKV